MGILEEIDKLELSDEQKATLRREYASEIDPLREQNDSLTARDRRSSVDTEIKALSDLGFSEAPGLLKYVRRIYLSADAEEPGAVLLSDNEMGLSGDEATGATGREEISVAGTLRKFIELMPRSQEGKLQLSDITVDDDHNRPDPGDNDPEKKVKEHRENLGRITGRSLDRTRKRYQGRAGVAAGGDA